MGRSRQRGVDRGAIERRSEQRDEIVDITAKEDASTQRKPRRRRREQVRGVELLEGAVACRVVGHLRDDPDPHSQLDVRLDHVGIERGKHDFRREPLRFERGSRQ